MMSPQHLSMNMNSSMNSLPITRDRFMKAKTFKPQEQQDQQQDQQQQQPMILPLSSFTMAAAVPVPVPTPAPIPVFVVTTNMRRRTTIRKSVRFNNCVRVAPFEKVTATEAKEVWLTSMELAAIKTEGRAMASSYRRLLSERQQQNQQHPPQPQHQQSPESLSNYRGFENVTIQRKRQKILANRSAIYAHLQGYKTEEIAFIYQQSTTFSTEIAFVQAIHDYAEIYTTNTNTNADAITTALQQQLPSVASCLPPTPLPFAIESAMFFQRQKREQRNKNQNQNKKRTRSVSSSRSQSRSRSPPLSPPTSSSSPPMSPIAFEQQINVQQQQQTCQQQQQATTVTRRVRQRV